MGETHRYHVVAWWASGRTGIAKSDSAPNAIQFTAPPEFQGLEGRWTPEDMLLCALASCFTSTFHAIAGYARFEYTDLEAEVEGVVSKIDSGYSFSEIVLRPSLTIPCKKERERAVELLQKAKATAKAAFNFDMGDANDRQLPCPHSFHSLALVLRSRNFPEERHRSQSLRRAISRNSCGCIEGKTDDSLLSGR